ncbi:MAG TPA: glycosyltransferase [Vicinamibacteria bacterium]
MAPRLSICIATMNRGSFLGQTLDSILAQATDEVEVVVVDGGSVDDTGEVVRQRQERFPRLRYFRLPAPGGVDQDFDRAVQQAEGRHCWLMSDDDLVKPGALAAVLAATARGYALVVVNAEVRDAALDEVLEANRLNIDADRQYRPEDAERLFVDTAGYLSFIGGVVIDREVWRAREPRRYFGSLFIHVGVIFQSPLPGDALAIAQPLVSIRFGNALWTARTFEIWMFKWPEMVWSLPHFSDAAKRRVCPREPWRRLRTLLVNRARGAFSTAEYRKWLEPRLTSGPQRLLARAVAGLPPRPLAVLAAIYYSMFYGRSRGLLADSLGVRWPSPWRRPRAPESR